MSRVWRLSTVSLLLLVLQLSAAIAGDSFSVVRTRRQGQRGNNFSLRCQNLTGVNFGIFAVLSEPKFYRNGLEFSHDDCMKNFSLFSNGSIAVHITPPCEGYIQCGTNVVLSPPITLYAYPELLNGTGIMRIQAIERANATLPCQMSVSRLNSLTVTWHRNMNGHSIPVTNGAISSEDYSLTLFNVTKRDAGLYFCRAVSNHLSDGNFKILSVPQVRLSITQKHKLPQFLKNMTYVPQGNRAQYTFAIKVCGTPPLIINWFLGSDEIESTESNNDGEVTSRVTITRLPSEVSFLYVSVSNTDRVSSKTYTISQKNIIFPHFINRNSTCVNGTNDDPGDVIEFIIKHGTISLLVLCAVFLAIIIGLVVFICYIRNKNIPKKQHCHKCKELIRNNSAQSSFTPPTSIEENLPLIEIDPLCRNPVASVLLEFGRHYKDKEKDTPLIGALQHVLIGVLEKDLNQENRKCAEFLQSSLANFSNHLQRGGAFPRSGVSIPAPSRQLSIESCASRRGSNNSHLETGFVNGSISPLRDSNARPILAMPKTTRSSSRDQLQVEGTRYTVRQSSCEEYRKAQENLIPDDGINVNS